MILEDRRTSLVDNDAAGKLTDGNCLDPPECLLGYRVEEVDPAAA